MEGGRYKKGLWSLEEDKILMDYISVHGKGRWNRIAKVTGLKRCGKSCRLRWMNYLSPNIKRGDFTEEEEDLIIRLHKLLGNRWSLIAGRVPGRTDNQVKNHWNTHLSKKLRVKKGASNMTDPNSLASASPGDGKAKGEPGPKACQDDGAAAQLPSCGSSDVVSGTQGENCHQQQAKFELVPDQELELTTSTNCLSSFWVANVDDSSLDTCGLMELFDQYDYCIDMGWHYF